MAIAWKDRCWRAKTEVRVRLHEARRLPVVATQPLEQFEKVTMEYPSALRLVELARRMNGHSDETLEPIYLRAPYITTPAR